MLLNRTGERASKTATKRPKADAKLNLRSDKLVWVASANPNEFKRFLSFTVMLKTKSFIEDSLHYISLR